MKRDAPNPVEQSAAAEFELFWAKWGDKYEGIGVDSDGARLLFFAGYAAGTQDALDKAREAFERPELRDAVEKRCRERIG